MQDKPGGEGGGLLIEPIPCPCVLWTLKRKRAHRQASALVTWCGQPNDQSRLGRLARRASFLGTEGHYQASLDILPSGASGRSTPGRCACFYRAPYQPTIGDRSKSFNQAQPIRKKRRARYAQAPITTPCWCRILPFLDRHPRHMEYWAGLDSLLGLSALKNGELSSCARWGQWRSWADHLPVLLLLERGRPVSLAGRASCQFFETRNARCLISSEHITFGKACASFPPWITCVVVARPVAWGTSKVSAVSLNTYQVSCQD